MTGRILISAPSSSSGKTLLTLGLIRASLKEGYRVQAFKAGPDYIDPSFHRSALGVPSYNLDLFLMGQAYCQDLLARKSAQADISIIEGAMGYYDGISTGSTASPWDLARATGTPAILVLDPQGMGASLGALVRGFLSHQDPSHIGGFILNRVRPMMASYYKKIIEGVTPVPVLGYLPDMGDMKIESRHLGLVSPEEVQDLEAKLNRLADQVIKSIDLKAIYSLASQAQALEVKKEEVQTNPPLRLGLAQDQALFFYYKDSLEALEARGVDLVPFSILESESLPKDLDGLYLGGGYPENFAEEISANRPLLDEIRTRVQDGLPLLAEGGGYMVLQEGFLANEERFHKWAGLFPGQVSLTNRLQNFGYASLETRKESPLGPSGTKVRGHEFHYSKLDNEGEGDIISTKPLSTRSWQGGRLEKNIFASYAHLHLASAPQALEAFVSKMREYKEEVHG